MIEFMHHDQLAMPMNGEDRVRAFYVDVLGFEEVEKPDILKDRGGVWFTRAAIDLHLGVEEPFIPAKKAHPAFGAPSLDKAIQHLQSRKVAYRRDIDLPNIRRIYIDDPFGNRIDLLERLRRSPISAPHMSSSLFRKLRF
ncbi:MAG: catechol 2,3-dioxygenase-like lactoylglutathione lyase family enzyme [Loktanella salsilacus]|jgi:catechol 2,3-dioxygenase-like lactoylglutathione lyase family enzyme|uniref:VOC family protein n=1 Tax=Loktanella salsilacus TaxID=195913 RepID=UPI0039897C7D